MKNKPVFLAYSLSGLKSLQMKMIALLLITALGLPGYEYGQSAVKLEAALSRKFPTASDEDGRWVFNADKANIKKVDKPLVQSCIPFYSFYQVSLTNYLGYHVNQGTCLVLFDSIKAKVLLVPPIWYGGSEESFIGLFIGQKFGTRDSLLHFLAELNELRQIGSGYQFWLTSCTDNLVTYDLAYSNGDTYTTGGNGTSSTVRYNEDGVWRKIRIDIKDLTIITYTEINPKSGDSIHIKSKYVPDPFDTIPVNKVPSH